MMTTATPRSALTDALQHEKRQGLNNTRRSDQHQRIGYLESGAAVVATLIWVLLFGAGLIISSAAYRNQLTLAPVLTWSLIAANVPMTLLTYTLTNVMFLCCLAGFLGAVGQRALIRGETVFVSENEIRSHYIAAIVGGFFIYLALLSGALVTNAISWDTKAADYQHLAGIASLLSFLLGYDRYLFAKLLLKLSSYADGVEIKKT